MSQPSPYTPTTDFSNEESNNVAGRSTVRTAMLDAELAAIETTLDQTLVNLSLNQRDDGEIRDLRVKLHTLGADVRALLATTGCVVRGAWLTATAYAVKDIVTESGNTYIAAVAHTSGTFATDLAASKWVKITAAAAADVSIVDASGRITATEVEGALQELSLASGVDVADANNYYTGATVEAVLAELGVKLGYIHLQDVRAGGTQGGSSANTTWHTRVLNTEVTDALNNCTLAANQFVLAAATYLIAARAPALACNGCQLRVRNVTAGTTLLLGASMYSPATAVVQIDTTVKGRFTVAAGQTLELQMWSSAAAATNGLGGVSNAGVGEVYAEVELWRIS